MAQSSKIWRAFCKRHGRDSPAKGMAGSKPGPDHLPVVPFMFVSSPSLEGRSLSFGYPLGEVSLGAPALLASATQAAL